MTRSGLAGMFRGDGSMAGEVLRAEDEVMEMAGSEVLLDPAFTVPAVPEAAAGVGWIRCMVPRFCEGEAHARRRGLAEQVIARIGRPQRLSSPTAALLAAMGLPAGLERDVAAVALAYQPHVPVPPEADAAADRLAAACGGRTEESAAKVCVLVQAHAATLALIARLQAGDEPDGMPAPGRRWRCTWPARGTSEPGIHLTARRTQPAHSNAGTAVMIGRPIVR